MQPLSERIPPAIQPLVEQYRSVAIPRAWLATDLPQLGTVTPLMTIKRERHPA